jgi:hypothetical protein
MACCNPSSLAHHISPASPFQLHPWSSTSSPASPARALLFFSTTARRAHLSVYLFFFLPPSSVPGRHTPRACAHDGMAGAALAHTPSRAGLPQGTLELTFGTLGAGRRIAATSPPWLRRHGWPWGKSTLVSSVPPPIRTIRAPTSPIPCTTAALGIRFPKSSTTSRLKQRRKRKGEKK